MADDKKKTTTKRAKGLRTEKVLEMLAEMHSANVKIRETRKAMREAGSKPTSKLRTHQEFLSALMVAGGYDSIEDASGKWERVVKQLAKDGFSVKTLPGLRKNKSAEMAKKYPGLLSRKRA